MNLNQLDTQARDAAKDYQGEFAWPTVIFGLVVFAAYLATPFLVTGGLVPLWLGTLIMIVLTYAAYTIMHDAAHGSISGSHKKLRWVNEWMGYGAAFVMLIPLTVHRHEHLTHHRNTNDPEGDPDVVFNDMTRSPFHAVRAASRSYKQQFAHYLTHKWESAPREQNVRVLIEFSVGVAARLVFCSLGYWTEGLVLFGLGGLGGFLLLMYLFAYIVHRPHEAVGRYVDTSVIVPPKWCSGIVTALWLSQNYHAIHHLFPRVPFYYYRRLFNQIRPCMEAHGAPIYRLTLTGIRADKNAGPGTAVVGVAS